MPCKWKDKSSKMSPYQYLFIYSKEEGFFSKDYFVKMHTQYGKVKLAMTSWDEAKINI